jgi:hypothetical protein
MTDARIFEVGATLARLNVKRGPEMMYGKRSPKIYSFVSVIFVVQCKTIILRMLEIINKLDQKSID